VSTVPASGSHGAQSVAEAAEKRWTLIVVAIIGLIIGMMMVTGLHWAAMPPSRVETIDVNTLHIKGEFVESNLGTSLEGDGEVIVRVLAQQYSFQPQCLVVPVDMPVTFRGTSSDAIHGFSVGSSNANTMLIPGFVATFTTTFRQPGEHLMPCHEYCGTGHEAMWARVQVISQQDFLTRTRTEKRLSCVRS
jgi:cytochrome c oxidase subunit II